MKTRTTAAFLLVVLLLGGCATPLYDDDSGEPLAHQIVIPEEFSWGAVSPHFPSSAERYLGSYDQGWWNCIEKFAEEIDYHPTTVDRIGNGWPEAISGYGDGYSAAEAKVKELRTRHGDQKAQELLKQSLQHPE